jgi:hypothetical protein
MASRGHVGKAGQLAVMSEFLLRGYNVAMPEVDLGEDIFVVHDRSGQLWRIQVKTGIGKARRDGYVAKVAVSLPQLEALRTPDLIDVFALRHQERWEFLIVPRKRLHREHESFEAGSLSGETVLFTLRFTETGVVCPGRDWQAWRGNWGEWPLTS